MVFICFIKKFPWWRVRTTLLCGHENKYLECSWGLCWFSKAVVVGSLSRSMTSLGSLAKFPAPGTISLFLRSSKVLLERAISYHQGMCGIIWAIMPCRLLWFIGWLAWIGAVGCFPPSEADGAMKQSSFLVQCLRPKLRSSLQSTNSYLLTNLLRNLYFFKTGSLYVALGCLGTHYVEQVVLELTDCCPPCLCLLSVGIRGVCYHSWLHLVFWDQIFYWDLIFAY